jgi:hypothetical protein
MRVKIGEVSIHGSIFGRASRRRHRMRRRIRVRVWLLEGLMRRGLGVGRWRVTVESARRLTLRRRRSRRRCEREASSNRLRKSRWRLEGCGGQMRELQATLPCVRLLLAISRGFYVSAVGSLAFWHARAPACAFGGLTNSLRKIRVMSTPLAAITLTHVKSTSTAMSNFPRDSFRPRVFRTSNQGNHARKSGQISRNP